MSTVQTLHPDLDLELDIETPRIPPQSVAIARTPMDLLSIALNNNAAIDIIERLANLQEKALEREAQFQFNEAMARVQSDIKRIAPDLKNPQTNSRYASYAALDKVVRPIYSQEGFSLSFDTADCPLPDCVRVLCHASKGSHTRDYQIDMPTDGKGAKGGDVLTKTHATGAAMSYGMRYLLKFIFNIAIGEEDRDGNSPASTKTDADRVTQHCQLMKTAQTKKDLQAFFRNAYGEAAQLQDRSAMAIYLRVKDARKRELE